MANNLSGYESAVIAAVNKVNSSLEAPRQFLGSVYTKIVPIVPSLNPKTIRIPYPSVSDWTDSGKDEVPVDDINDNFVEMPFENFPAKAIKLHDIDQGFHPDQVDVMADYIAEVVKKGRAYLNKRIATLFTAGNFNAYSAISATSSLITVANFLDAQETLASAEVEVDDTENMTLMIHTRVNRAIKGSNDWVQASQVSDGLAAEDRARSVGRTWTAYETMIKSDVHVPTSGSAPSRTFTCALFHRSAVAVGFKPLPKPDPKLIDTVYNTVGASKDGQGNIPMRFMKWYEPLQRSWLFMADFGFGQKVIDPKRGRLISVAE